MVTETAACRRCGAHVGGTYTQRRCLVCGAWHGWSLVLCFFGFHPYHRLTPKATCDDCGRFML